MDSKQTIYSAYLGMLADGDSPEKAKEAIGDRFPWFDHSPLDFLGEARGDFAEAERMAANHTVRQTLGRMRAGRRLTVEAK